MMVLVDTTVWVDFFAARSMPHVTALETLIKRREDLCICGIIMAEVLQGIRDDAEFKRTSGLLGTLIYLPKPHRVFLQSAQIYQGLRRKGITIRKSLDCMIAAVAIEHDISFLYHDRDFRPIEAHFGLKAMDLHALGG